jgi:very-short-patch-repair endonuclease
MHWCALTCTAGRARHRVACQQVSTGLGSAQPATRLPGAAQHRRRVRWQTVLDRQQGLATRRQLTDAGLSRRGLERLVGSGQLWRRDSGLLCDRVLPERGPHLLSGGAVDPRYVADVREQLLCRGPGARAARSTAAVLLGLDLVHEPERVHLDVPRGNRPVDRADVQVRTSRSRTVGTWRPLPGLAPLAVTPPTATVLACAAELPLAEAVVVVDSALRVRRCTRAELVTALERRRGVGELQHLRHALRWCDARSGSVLESLLRVLLLDAGLPPPRTQHVLHDPLTGRVRRVDFAWLEQRLVVEADGRRWHDPRDVRDDDRRRDNGWAVLGWRVLRFTWADVVADSGGVVQAVRAALA